MKEFSLIVSFHTVVAHLLLTIAVFVMGITLAQSSKLLEILKGSKAETLWRRSQMGLILLTAFYIIIMITQLLDMENFFSTRSENSFHEIIMNSSFLLTSLLLLQLVNLDIKAFSSLFELLKGEH